MQYTIVYYSIYSVSYSYTLALGQSYTRDMMDGSQCSSAYVEVFTSDSYRVISTAPVVSPSCGRINPTEVNTPSKFVGFISR